MSAVLITTYFAINFFGFATKKEEVTSFANLDQCENHLEIKFKKFDNDPKFEVNYNMDRLYLSISDRKAKTLTSYKCRPSDSTNDQA